MKRMKLIKWGLMLVMAGAVMPGCGRAEVEVLPTEKWCTSQAGGRMELAEALERARENNCSYGGPERVVVGETAECNDYTGTWWVEIKMEPAKEGCNPACVVSVVDKTAEINWRCTGLILPD